MAGRDLELRSSLQLSPRNCLVQIEPVHAPTQGAQEATYLSGVMPEFHGQTSTFENAPALPPPEMAFWTRAAKRRQEVQASVIDGVTAPDILLRYRGLVLFKITAPADSGEGRFLGLDSPFLNCAREALKRAWVMCLLGVPSGANKSDRGLMLGLGFEHKKTLIGACEVAGVLDRVLTGVELGDKA